MAEPIVVTSIPCDHSQKAELEALFSSTGYSLLKRLLASHCIKEQVTAANKGLYESGSEIASSQAKHHRQRAEYINALLDVLDDMRQKRISGS